MMADQATGAEYPDFIVRRDCEREAMRCIVDGLKATKRQWDCLWFPSVSGWTGARQRITAAPELGGFYAHSRPARFAHIELPPTIEAYERSLSDNRRKQFRTQRSKILGKSGATVTRCASIEELPAYLDTLFELHNARRKLLGEEGTFSRKPDKVRFYRDFAPKALAAGWLWLFALRDGGAIKAVQLGYVYNNVFHQMQEGFDPEYTPGAGNVLRLEVIRECIAGGIRDYDFLGGYTEHKRRWMAQPRYGVDLFIGRASLSNRVIFLGNVWPTGRYLRPVPA
jgi:CelD/BcsL family acetyltransferase involved in cellulose biosynthesis